MHTDIYRNGPARLIAIFILIHSRKSVSVLRGHVMSRNLPRMAERWRRGGRGNRSVNHPSQEAGDPFAPPQHSHAVK